MCRWYVSCWVYKWVRETVCAQGAHANRYMQYKTEQLWQKKKVQICMGTWKAIQQDLHCIRVVTGFSTWYFHQHTVLSRYWKSVDGWIIQTRRLGQISALKFMYTFQNSPSNTGWPILKVISSKLRFCLFKKIYAYTHPTPRITVRTRKIYKTCSLPSRYSQSGETDPEKQSQTGRRA